MFVMRQSIHHLEHGVAGLVLGSVLGMRGRGLQHLLERGKERGEERGVLGVHDLDALANRRDQREAILGLVILDQLFRVRLELAAREGRKGGNGAGGPGVDFVVLGGKTLLSLQRARITAPGDPGGSARASIFLE